MRNKTQKKSLNFEISVVTLTTTPIDVAANEEIINSSEMGIATDQRQQRECNYAFILSISIF